MYDILTKHPDVHWAASVVSHTEIDEVNILQATMNGMRRSTEDLLKKLEKQKLKGSCIALVDGNRVPTNMPIDAEFVIKGDGSIFSIAAASIIAKVTRDRIMLELDKEFPQYNLAQHKGYPTFEHRSLLMKHGPCSIHRTSYAPVKLAMAAHASKNKKVAPVCSFSSDASLDSADQPVSGMRVRSVKSRAISLANVEPPVNITISAKNATSGARANKRANSTKKAVVVKVARSTMGACAKVTCKSEGGHAKGGLISGSCEEAEAALSSKFVKEERKGIESKTAASERTTTRDAAVVGPRRSSRLTLK